jgi:DNA-binding LacI/PurR family transcriptional regulator
MAAVSGHVLLSDVAAAAGVSLATASRALNGQTGVGAELAEKVRVVARNLGYVPNVHARQLAGGTTSVIGLIVHEIDDPFFTEIAGGIVRSALAENLMVQVSHSDETRSKSSRRSPRWWFRTSTASSLRDRATSTRPRRPAPRK